MSRLVALIALLSMPLMAFASEGMERLDLTGNWVGITSVLLFFAAYLFVMAEEFIHLRANSGANWTRIPEQTGQPFQSKLDSKIEM